jgi:uncharacterized spore protein YtfJ
MDEASAHDGRLTEALASGIPDRGVGLAFGATRTVDGVALIPVAFVTYGFGGTEGSGRIGTGGGGGGVAIPLGAYVTRDGSMVFRPNPIALLAMVTPLIGALGFAVSKIIAVRGPAGEHRR